MRELGLGQARGCIGQRVRNQQGHHHWIAGASPDVRTRLNVSKRWSGDHVGHRARMAAPVKLHGGGRE
jgi:hypothetical protein